nr:hypothetical protein [Patescibacteria group bacterium]
MTHPSLFKRFARVFILGFTIVCLGFGTAVPATQAFLGVGDVGTVNVNSDLPRTVSEQGSRVWSGLASAAIGSLFNALQLFLGQIAYDAADYIASGGNGQSALFYRKGFLGYLKDVGGAAVGDFVGSLSDSSFFHGIGLNLCQPTNPDVLKNLVQTLGQLGQQSFPTPNIPSMGALGVSGRFDRPRPRCQLQQITQNYSNLYQTMTNGEVLRSVEAAFDSQVNELGTISTIYNRFLDNVQTSLQTASSDRREGQGFSSVTDLISGNIRTPASVINSATNDFLVKQPSANQTAIVGALLNNAMTLGATQLLSYTASIFVNTLVSKLMKNIFEKGIFKAYGLRTWSTGTNSIDSIAIYGKTDSRNANINLKDISFFKQVSFDALADLQACPDGVARGPWNCTIDQSLATAIAARTDKASISIRSGIENGYLHGDWQLIPESNTRLNTDPTCYSTAYCTGNIKKLRSLRILPAGFEFAANGEANMEMCRQGKCATLKEVVDGFLDCNEEGMLDAAHPWCHLIDPNWVIASVPQQCALQGFGDTLLSDKTPIRSEQCADVQTCLRRDDQGNCIGGYGYCMAERTAYRFQADSCSAEYASCRTYTTRSSQNTSLIRYSLDRGQCSADNVGCLWYASQRLATPGRNDDWLATTSTGPRVYFNKNVETCAASEEGCTKLYAATAGVSALNLLINGSFERRDQASSTLQSWVVDQDQLLAPMAEYTSSTSFTGGLAFYADSSGKDLRQQVALKGGRTYTLSFLARVSDRVSGASTSKFNFVPYRRNATTGDLETFPRAELARYYYTRNSCILLGVSEVPAYRFSSGPTADVIDSLMTLDWRRFECTFVTPPEATAGDFTISGTNILVDAAQLEESEYATDFVDGLNEQLPVVHLKIAPEEFACKGEPADHQVCSAFAQVCQQSEAGCQGYTDVVGGSEVPAILSSADTCPAQCVGYSEYRKGASAFDLVRNSDTRFDDPTEVSSTAFIPTTGQQCSQADVGCEQFTFMDGPTAGSVGTYNYLRSCEAPDANSETFFTWEGADTTGYQLRTWSLKHDAALGGPRILAKLQADQLNFKEPETCNAALWRTGFDPDCRQFYNANGTTYYRYFSQTIISSSQCTALRYSASNEADCIKTGGEYSTGGQCVYRAFLPESQSCRPQAAT